MAKIEMDISEYEAMKENAELLKKALKKEEKLGKKIEALQKEKIKILEENDKVVTTVLIKRTAETKSSYLPQHEIIKRVQQSIVADSDYFRRVGQMTENEMIHRRMSMSGKDVYSFFDSFFETHTHEFETSKEVTREGLDEVTSVIRKELREELDENVKEDIEHLKRLIKEKTSWYKEFEDAEEFGKAKDKEASTLSKCLEESIQQVEDLNEEIKGYEKLNEIIKNQPTSLFMSFSTFKSNLLKEIKEHKEKKND